jgi:hypothetical protein
VGRKGRCRCCGGVACRRPSLLLLRRRGVLPAAATAAAWRAGGRRCCCCGGLACCLPPPLLLLLQWRAGGRRCCCCGVACGLLLRRSGVQAAVAVAAAAWRAACRCCCCCCRCSGVRAAVAAAAAAVAWHAACRCCCYRGVRRCACCCLPSMQWRAGGSGCPECAAVVGCCYERRELVIVVALSPQSRTPSRRDNQRNRLIGWALVMRTHACEAEQASAAPIVISIDIGKQRQRLSPHSSDFSSIRCSLLWPACFGVLRRPALCSWSIIVFRTLLSVLHKLCWACRPGGLRFPSFSSFLPPCKRNP